MQFNTASGENMKFIASYKWTNPTKWDASVITVSISSGSPANTFTINNHGLTTADYITVLAVGKAGVTLSGAIPSGLSPFTRYYVINPTANTFQLSTTSGGTAITISSTGDATGWWMERTSYSGTGCTLTNLGGLKRFRIAVYGPSQQTVAMQFNGVGTQVYSTTSNSYTTFSIHNKGDGYSYMDFVNIGNRFVGSGPSVTNFINGANTAIQYCWTTPDSVNFANGLNSLTVTLGGAAVYDGCTVELWAIGGVN